MAPEAPSDEAVLRATRCWLERAVIGLGLCPFARPVFTKGQIRYFVSGAEDSAALLLDLQQELRTLTEADAERVETTLLVVPHMLADFLDYNDFLKLADASLQKLGLAGVVQIASFHPAYQFGDLEADDVANCTNRSPYPILHLLRESSVTRAVESFPAAAQIFEQNVTTLRALQKDPAALARDWIA